MVNFTLISLQFAPDRKNKSNISWFLFHFGTGHAKDKKHLFTDSCPSPDSAFKDSGKIIVAIWLNFESDSRSERYLMLEWNLQRNSNHFLRVWRLDYSMLIEMHTDDKISMNLIASRDSLQTGRNKRSCLRNQNFILSRLRLINAVRKFKIPKECCFLFRSKPVQMQILAPLWNPLGGLSSTLCHTSVDFRQSQKRTSGLARACSVITKFFSSQKSVLFSEWLN